MRHHVYMAFIEAVPHLHFCIAKSDQDTKNCYFLGLRSNLFWTEKNSPSFQIEARICHQLRNFTWKQIKNIEIEVF